MRSPASPSMPRLASRSDSTSQNGQPVRPYRHHVPQRQHDSNRRRPGSTPTSCAMAGRDPQTGQYRRSQRSSLRHPANASTSGPRDAVSVSQPRHRGSPGRTGAMPSSLSSQLTTRRGASESALNSSLRARASSAAAAAGQSSSPPGARPAPPPTDRRSTSLRLTSDLVGSVTPASMARAALRAT
jgi:hypothetical protein